MKNEARFTAARKFALSAISGMADALFNMANRPAASLRWSSERRAIAKPANNVSGAKMAKAASRGILGLGQQASGKPMAGAASGVTETFSPKRDIGKGPAWTLSQRDLARCSGTKRVARRMNPAFRY